MRFKSHLISKFIVQKNKIHNKLIQEPKNIIQLQLIETEQFDNDYMLNQTNIGGSRECFSNKLLKSERRETILYV